MKIEKIEAVGLALSILAVIFFCFFISQNVFPAFKYALSDGNLVETTQPIGREVSLFMWNYRSIDLIAQALVLFAAAAGCLAILRNEEKGEAEKPE